MKVKLKNLGQKAKVPNYEAPAKGNAKTEIEYPEVRVSSSQMDGLDKLSIGKKCKLTFEAEVVSLKKPDNWEVRRGEGKDEILASFKLLKGALEPMNIAEAAKRMKESGEKY